jgi:hypothetical protein
MTKAASFVGDNGGLCEGCNGPQTEFVTQTAVPIMLGGGLGPGTIWLCPPCKRDHEKRHHEVGAAEVAKIREGTR